MEFSSVTIERLNGADRATMDSLDFGVIGFNPATEVDVYNATESRLAGLSPERVLGRQFFTAVAPCMNNYLVAQRFEDEASIDDTIDYVLTLKMRPTSVKLRLLKDPSSERRFILVAR